MLKTLRCAAQGVPTPMAGLALGVASLGLGLENALPLHSQGQILGALVSSALVLLILTRFALHPARFLEELRHPVLGSILPTLTMALMLQSKSLNFVAPQAAQVLWLASVAAHLVLLLAFVVFRARAFRLHHMVPSWFVPFVGLGAAALTVPDAQYHDLAYALLCVAMASYALLLPLMAYRLIFAQEIADPFKPTIAIMAAPASLLLAAYLTLEKTPSLLLCSLLLGIAVLMTSIIYLAFGKLLRLPFSPAFAAYTFPMCIGATALYIVSERLAEFPATHVYSAQLGTLAVIEMVVATLVVAYVAARYLVWSVRAAAAVMQAKKAAKLEDTVKAPAGGEAVERAESAVQAQPWAAAPCCVWPMRS